MKKMIVLAACMVLVASAAFAAGITNTKHDLGVGSTSGGYVAAGTTEICVFCHTPHGAQGNTLAPLWNRTTTATVFTPYSSTTMTAVIAAIGGASRACMSCHDGTLTIAGSVANQPNAGAITAGADAGNVVADLITGYPNLGVSLANDHPVSFTYADSVAGGGLLAAPTAGSGAVLIGTQVECASCHQVHDNTISPFLRGSMARSALCLGCHVK